MKVYQASQAIQQRALTVFFSLLMLLLTFLVLKQSLTCVDAMGCRLEYCATHLNLKEDYKTLIAESQEGNPACQF